MHLLDTDTLTHLHAGNENVQRQLQILDDPEIGITIITKIELLRGRFDFILKAADSTQLLRAQRWLTRTEALLTQLRIVHFNDQSAEWFDQLRKDSSLRKIGRADLLIGSIALTHNAVLVTRNLRHFRQIPRLKVVNWVDG
jgi:tRNA(fMet)-specific endonuclease VapC